MRKSRFIIIILVLFFIALSCERPRFASSAKDPRTDLFRLGIYSFPARSMMIQRKNGKENIQRDEYGRECCVFHIADSGWFYSDLPEAGKYPSAIVILQACRNDRIYYYEDICFRIIPEDGLSDIELASFMEQNDWNMPFREENCSSRFYSKTGWDYDGMPMEGVSDFVKVIGGQYFPDQIDWGCLSEDKDGNVLLWMVEKTGKAGFEAEEAKWIEEHPKLYKSILYGFIHSRRWDRQMSNNPCTNWMVLRPIDREFDFERDVMRVDTLDFGPALHEFKVAHGWVFE